MVKGANWSIHKLLIINKLCHIERLTTNQKAVGSNPAGRTRENLRFQQLTLFLGFQS
jgi:hypothetical protein